MFLDIVTADTDVPCQGEGREFESRRPLHIALYQGLYTRQQGTPPLLRVSLTLTLGGADLIRFVRLKYPKVCEAEPGRIAEDDDVRRVRGLARVADVSDDGDLDELRRAAISDPAARLRLATALAAAGQEEEAIDTYVGLVRGRDEHADDARSALLDLFAVLGDTDERVITGRRSLASALF